MARAIDCPKSYKKCPESEGNCPEKVKNIQKTGSYNDLSRKPGQALLKNHLPTI
jgi:hypothetical protein